MLLLSAAADPARREWLTTRTDASAAARRNAEGARAASRSPGAAGPRAAAAGERLSSRTAGHATAPPGPATGWRLVDEQEGPLVVVIASLVQADRLFLALADDAHHAAGDGAAAERAGHLRAAGRARLDARGTTGLPTACAARDRGVLPGKRRARADRNEVAVGDRVLELLADVPALDQHVDTGRQRLVLRLEQANRADVLLPAEDELLFLLALDVVAPHGQRNRHQHRHDRQRHEQRGHGVTV